MSKVLIIDDSHPDIHYSGSWTTATSVSTNTNEYNFTVHRSSVAGDELTYTFYGTQINVYGTLLPSDIGPLSFSVDGSTPPTAFNDTGTIRVDNRAIITSHMLLYQSPGMARDTHTLSIKTGTPRNPAAFFYLDFFTVSSGGDSVEGNVMVDDRDSAISYAGEWGRAGATDEYLGTTMHAPPGGSATFHFNGTSLTVFGTTSNTGNASTTATIAFSVDGANNYSYTGAQNSLPIKHIPFYHVDNLSSDREHTVSMSSVNSNVWYVDYLVYTTKNSVMPVPNDPGNGGGGDGGGSKPNAGLIAGVVVAAVVALGAIWAIIFLIRRRRRAATPVAEPLKEKPAGPPDNRSPYVVPYASPDRETPGLLSSPGHSPGLIPATKDSRVGASATHLLNTGPLSPGVESSEYSSAVTTSTDPLLYYGHPQEHAASPPRQSYGQPLYSHNMPLYPQFDARSAQRMDPTPHSGPSYAQAPYPGDQYEGRPSGEKSRFGVIPTQPTHRPPPSSTAPTVEQDSGIRLPVTSPPMYTQD